MASSLEPLFSPKSVAIIGASRKKSSIGYATIHNLLNSEFSGTIYPVNPYAKSVHSIPAYPSVKAIPEEVDLAVVLVSKEFVEQVVDECIEKGVKALVVITAGFRETGPEGAERERRITEKVRQAGIRMVGPNCMGIINTDPEIRLNATFAPTPAKRGSIGFVSQSGALGVAILNSLERLGLGLTQFISMGNKADVSSNDLLEYWETKDATKVIAMYLESFGNPRKFTELARRIGRKKPIIMVKSGRTPEGARAASSHTGALAARDVIISRFLEHCGVVRVESIEELFHTAQVFERWQDVGGQRIAIITNAGGPGIMATDACIGFGLEVPTLSEGLQEKLKPYLPKEASFQNPVDLLAPAGAKEYSVALDLVLGSGEVDMALVISVPPQLGRPMEMVEAVSFVAKKYPHIPVLSVIMAEESFYQQVRGRQDILPIFSFPEPAAKALSKLCQYAEWKRRPVEKKLSFEVDDEAVDKLLQEGKRGEYLPQEVAFRILELYGIPLAKWQIAPPKWEAVRHAAQKVGYPLVLKATGKDLVHKSDVGAVALNLKSEAELEEAFWQMQKALHEHGLAAEAFSLQEFLQGGYELVLGASMEPKFGPVVMFGLGGKFVEVLRDVCFGIPPLSPLDAEEMLRSIRAYPILEGVRGEKGVDLELLKEVLMRLSQLVHRHPQIQELDINPFLANSDRENSKAVDVRIRL